MNTEERLAAIEVAVKYQSNQIDEIKQMLSDIQSSLKERQNLNGHQDVSIARLQTQVAQHEEDLKQLNKDVDFVVRKIYWIVGVLTALQLVVQIVWR